MFVLFEFAEVQMGAEGKGLVIVDVDETRGFVLFVMIVARFGFVLSST